MATVKRDFGSFHASNVEELLSQSDEIYKAPVISISLPDFQDIDKSFGRGFKEKHFLLEPQCTFLNHGAFGGVLKPAQEVAQSWQRYAERQPLRFFDREILPLMVSVTRRLAAFVNCPARDLVLMTNATTANSTVIERIVLAPADNVFMLNTTYGAVQKHLRYKCAQTGANLVTCNLKFPLTCVDDIIQAVKHSLPINTKLAVFDHIPSNHSFVMPIKELVKLCHERGVPVLVDGAHALGSLDLDLTNIGNVEEGGREELIFIITTNSTFS